MGKIGTYWHRVWDRNGPQYLVTLFIGIEHAWGGGGENCNAYPQAWAVVDDFGNLVTMEKFQ